MGIYTASQVFRVHVELTTRCNAACPMCPRTRAGGEPNPNLPLTELTLSDFQTMFPPSLLRRLKQFLFCGNYGDALTARDTLPICEYLRRENPKLRVKLVTNGSGRDAAFWSALAGLVTTVTFSIDGLGEVNQIYRRRTSWERVMDAVRAYLAAGGRAEWDYLVFRHTKSPRPKRSPNSSALPSSTSSVPSAFWSMVKRSSAFPCSRPKAASLIT